MNIKFNKQGGTVILTYRIQVIFFRSHVLNKWKFHIHSTLNFSQQGDIQVVHIFCSYRKEKNCIGWVGISISENISHWNCLPTRKMGGKKTRSLLSGTTF